MKKQIKSLKERIDKLTEELKKAENEVFNELRDTLFRENSKLKSFGFTGYTPEFNDGEPCKFTLTTDSDYLQINGYDRYRCEWNDDEEHSKEEMKDVESLSIIVSETLSILPESFYKSKFGEGFRVNVTADKIEVEDYDCGY
ncbi:hypothetical protein EB151_11640 [archaeon]|nr:hypothetical protein [archaeon]